MNSSKSIAFCAPLMNRDEDLKSTLAHNLSVLEHFKENVKLYINIFADEHSLETWVKGNFSEQIESGVLHITTMKKLEYWHFSWAKNSFQNLIEEDYYSSLDGDNFLSFNLVKSLLDVINKHERVLFHGFSGAWGDGSSGQLTLPKDLYIKYGYLDNIYPRQYDENGLISRSLYGEKDLKYVSYESVDITSKSGAFKKAREFKELENEKLQIPKVNEDAPLNPRGAGYVEKDKKLSYFQNFNEAYTYLTCLDSAEAESFHRDKLFNSLNLLDQELISQVLPLTFDYKKQCTQSDCLTVFSVIKNDEVFLDKWLAHYRRLGVSRFIIVDDHSEKPLEKSINSEDVFIFRPKVGDFKNCKVYWLKLLMLAVQTKNSWCLTIDSDEFIDLGDDFKSVGAYIKKLESKKLNKGPAVLVDMLPGPSFRMSGFNGENFENDFTNFYCRPAKYQPEYYSHNSIKWGFGKYAEYSYRLDSRWRFFQTFDSLRKVPIFKFHESVNLNQGFHTLSYGKGVTKANDLFSQPEIILPVKHFKFVSFFLKKENESTAYHARTKKNLDKIRSQSPNDVLKSMKYSPFVKKFDTKSFSSVFFKPIGLYRIIGNDIPGLHSEEQTYVNLKFILENEPRFDEVDSYFVLNRINDSDKLQKYKELLIQHNAKFLEIPFDINVYRKIKLDKPELPSGYKLKTNWDKLCFEIAKRESRNRYAINNNGARNFALEHGLDRHELVLPWDGNCFLNKKIVERLREQAFEHDYTIVPMERVVANTQYLIDNYPSNAVEEPQIGFRKGARLKFNDEYFYGYQPKVELLKRLDVRGMWDDWKKIYPWKACNVTPTVNGEKVAIASATYRLASGNIETALSSMSRSHARANGIVEYLDSI